MISPRKASLGRHFVDWVQEQLPDGLGVTDKDLVVTTILSSAIKCAAKALISRALRENTNKRVGEAALVAHWATGVSVPWREPGISGSVDTTEHLRCAAYQARPSSRCFMPRPWNRLCGRAMR